MTSGKGTITPLTCAVSCRIQAATVTRSD
jgi:hypothetical protein